jgi:hypothetical protein
VRGRSSAVLLALAVAALAPSLAIAQYAPKWRVGDWWVTRTFERWSDLASGGWASQDMKYRVVGIEKVGKRDCYTVETRYLGCQATDVFYVRRDDWRIVRRVVTTEFDRKLRPSTVRDCPLGQYGPFSGEPRLPRFPLQPGIPDTTFKLTRLDRYSAWLREMSDVADSNLVNRLLNEGDSAGGRVLRPTGKVYRVRSEGGGNLEPSPYGGERRIVQSLQLWSEDLPWRAYEELVQYDGPKPIRRVVERSWLIANGHLER